MTKLDDLNGKRIEDVLTPKDIAMDICNFMDVNETIVDLTLGKLKNSVIEDVNKSTVFGALPFGSQAELAQFLQYNHENLFTPIEKGVNKTIVDLLFDKCEDLAKPENRNLKGIQFFDLISVFISTFSKILARHLSESSICSLVGGQMGSLADESKEIDFRTSKGETVQVLTSKAKNLPTSASEKIDNPKNVDKYVVIHYKNDGKAGIGVQKVIKGKKVPKDERAHITARYA